MYLIKAVKKKKKKKKGHSPMITLSVTEPGFKPSTPVLCILHHVV